MNSKTAPASGFSHVPAYADYQLVRLRPIMQQLCLAGAALILLLLAWDIGSDAPGRDQALAWRALASVPMIAAVVAMQRRLFERHFVNMMLLLSLLSFCCLAQNFILLPERTVYLPVVIFFFNLGFVLVAPLITPTQVLLNLLVPMPLIWLLLWLGGVHEQHFLQLLLHVFPLMLFLNYIAWHIRGMSRASFELYRRNVELATFDPLTQLLNRRAWEQQSLIIYRKALREGKHFAILITDIDYFKRVNDTYGHHAGDLTLKKLAQTLRATLRDYDIIGRFGGEEFVVSVSNLAPDQILALGERLRQVVEATEIRIEGDKTVRVTTSVGIAIMEEGDTDMSDILKRSDFALYQAKQQGRNRVECCGRAAHAPAVA